jgi:2-oxoglutarate ferredoxin oxidoreductase subunit delta
MASQQLRVCAPYAGLIRIGGELRPKLNQKFKFLALPWYLMNMLFCTRPESIVIMVADDMNRVEIYQGWCKKCGICVAFCPPKILEEDEASYPVVKDVEKCTGCRWCEIRCPDFAIVVHGDDTGHEKTSSSGQ